MSRILTLGISLLLAYGAAAFGSFFTASSVESWYTTLAKPALNPPAWVFGPVWTLLYGLMAIAAWRVWERRTASPDRGRRALYLYGVQLVLNGLWSFVFFGLRNPALASVVIGALLVLIFATLVRFHPIDRLASWLLVPYLLWVAFASYLNISIALRM